MKLEVKGMLGELGTREVVLLVRELHVRGYEQMRLFGYMAPTGMSWRWFIYPKCFLNGDPRHERWHDPILFPCLGGSTGPCSGHDCKLAADDFAATYPELMEMAKGSDPEYVRWYKRIADVADRYVPEAFVDYPREKEGWILGDEVIPYPPFEA